MDSEHQAAHVTEHEAITSGPAHDLDDDVFQRSGLGALLAAAATETPRALLLRDDTGALTANETMRRTLAAAFLLRSFGIAPGDRVLLVAGAQTAALVSLAALVRIGAEPALVQPGLGPVELAAHARAAKATALIGPSRYGSLDLGDAYLSTAALIDTIRIIASLGPEGIDGAADLSGTALDSVAASEDAMATGEAPMIATFEGPASAPCLVLHRQAALLADALSLVEYARILPTRRLVSTLPLASMAGLVAGPFAALVGAANLTLHGPFDALRFLAACDAERGAHLVVPTAMAGAFAETCLTKDLTSLILVSRFADQHSFALPAPLTCDRPLVDLYAFGEDTLLARRRTDGEAHPPSRITDKRPDGGLGAQLNRAQAELRLSERS